MELWGENGTSNRSMFSAWWSWGSLLGTGPARKSVGQGQSHTQGLRPQADLPAGYIRVATGACPCISA